jgi:phosphonate transport system permease protein
MNVASSRVRPPDSWFLRPALTIRTALLLILVCVALAVSSKRMQIDQLAELSAGAVAAGVGLQPHSQVSDGFWRVVSGMFPMQLEEVHETNRIENFDRNQLPWGAHLEVRRTSTSRIDPITLRMTSTTTATEVLVEPYGYLQRVVRLMLETIEIAIWGTILALLVALPWAWVAARNYTPHITVYALVRGVSGFVRAIPELISALLLVLIFGFGPGVGVMALGLHTAGFLVKFFAEDIENASLAPQEALRAAGASKLQVLRFAVLPQVLPSYLAYSQYILERNIRSAAVIGIVGAGGIGQELKGRFEMFDFAHVGTILCAIVTTVLLLELATGSLRRKVI